MTRREALGAAGIYLLLAVVFLGQGLLPGRTMSNADYLFSEPPWTRDRPANVEAFGANHELVDPFAQFEPALQFTKDALPRIPLWNPHIMGGRPFLADQQAAVFSPYSVPSYVLPVHRSFVFAEILKLFVASFGAFLFARLALRMRFPGALLVGVVYAYGLFFVAWLPWPLASVWSYIPWLLLLADRVARAPAPLPVAGLSLAVGLQFLGGHPESSFHALAFTAAFFALRLVQRGRGAWLRPLAAGIGALVLGALLAALVLVPFVEMLAHSSDVEVRAGMGPAVASRKALIGILLPDYFGRPTQTSLGAGFLVERAFYAGALTLVLAGVALLRPTVERVFFAVLGAGSLAVVVGVHPLVVALRVLPGFHTAHNTRLTIVYLLSLGVLAGFALDDLVASPRLAGRRRQALWALAGALVLVPVALLAVRGYLAPHLLGDALNVAWGFADAPEIQAPDARGIIRLASLLVWLPFIGLSLALVAARTSGRLGPRAFAGLAIVLVAADLFRAGMGENPAIPVSHIHLPRTPALAYLQARDDSRFVGASTYNAFPLWPNTAMRWGLYDARGYDYPIVRRYFRLWKRHVAPQPGFAPPTMLAPINATSMRALSLLGVTSVLEAPDAPALRAPGLRLAYQGRDAKVYANPAAMPRAALVGAVQVVPGEEAALAAVGAPGFDPRRVAIAERPIPGLPSAPPSRPPGRAQTTTYEPERVVVRTRAAASSLLVLDDVQYPGWQATVDGRRAPIERVDYLLRGVRLPAGVHTVEMRYRPVSWRAGWITSLVALLALLALAGYGVARQTRTARARNSSSS